MSPSNLDRGLSSRSRELLEETFLEPDHMQAFTEALALNDLVPDPVTVPTTPAQGPSQATSPRLGNASLSGQSSPTATKKSGYGWEKVESIKSLSDFAPVHQKISRKKRRNSHGGGGGKAYEQPKIGFGYYLFRWPLLALIFLFIYFEFGMYVILRQTVSGIEWLVSCISNRKTRRLLKDLSRATSYSEYRKTCLAIDDAIGFSDWKKQDEDPKYDYPLMRKVKRSLIYFRKQNDMEGLMGVLEICTRNNFAGIEGVRMYSETFLGTKDLIESYINEVTASLNYVLESSSVSSTDKRRFFRTINKNYGSSALCLSGGAGFGYYHFGVIKAFLEADLLPKVITGTSAGGLVAALTCTRTDEELSHLLIPELAQKITACSEPFSKWFPRFWNTGARFSAVEWAAKATFFTRGSMTFREAFERTGRALNVSVIPNDRHSPTKVLNYLTAPDCVIWSAIIASAAVPGILPGVVLMRKTRDNELRPMNFGSKYKDGSLRVDIPLESLHLLFNMNFAIVSQVNPHVHLFFFGSRGSVGSPVRHRKGKGWRGGFLLSAAEQYLKLELTKNFKVIRDLELMPQLLGNDWSSVFLQRFAGSVTILPRSRLMDWFRLLKDPDGKELERMMKVGQSVAWPTLHMIENRLKIERAIMKGRQAVRQSAQKSKAAVGAQTAKDSATDTPAKDTPETKTPSPSHQPGHIGPWPASSSLSKSPTFIPLESDAEDGFAARSRFMKMTTMPNYHPSGGGGASLAQEDEGDTHDERGSGSVGGHGMSYARAAKTGLEGGHVRRRQRYRTASPDMEFAGRRRSWSRTHTLELNQLLHGRLPGFEEDDEQDDNVHSEDVVNSDEVEEQIEESMLNEVNGERATWPTTRASHGRSSSLSSSPFAVLPRFGSLSLGGGGGGGSAAAAANPSSTGAQSSGSHTSPASPAAPLAPFTTRISRWLSPVSTPRPPTSSSTTQQRPRTLATGFLQGEDRGALNDDDDGESEVTSDTSSEEGGYEEFAQEIADRERRQLLKSTHLRHPKASAS